MPKTIDAEQANSKSREEASNARPEERSTADEFQKTVRENSRTIAILTHIGSIFLGPVAPLLVYLFVSDEAVKSAAKEVLNFEITLWVVLGISGFLTGLLLIGLWFLLITIPLGLLTGLVFVSAALAQLILPIIGAIQASEGKQYRYPFTFRIVK